MVGDAEESDADASDGGGVKEPLVDIVGQNETKKMKMKSQNVCGRSTTTRKTFKINEINPWQHVEQRTWPTRMLRDKNIHSICIYFRITSNAKIKERKGCKRQTDTPADKTAGYRNKKNWERLK